MTTTAPTSTTAPLSGKVALITGSTSGIGAATAAVLAERGAHVLVSGRDAVRGETVAARIHEQGGKADFLPADLGDADAVLDLARRATTAGGGQVDILVNNTGIFPFGDADAVLDLARRATTAGGGQVDTLVKNTGIFPFGPTDQATVDVIDQVHAVNVRAPFLLVGALAPGMAERGFGAIVNVTRMVAEFGMAGMALYGRARRR
ncbi:hypothetical protein GCM10018793_68270 [Streptomyces sulfonofaciens]|uniref:Uncharacterized protein n=1 Tax=Streptomyces sulfonofaciens TaxID=68272 RepID=A0A919GPB5_9ACTN|nr:hypothetical protein GCM10018793_68270 [Streptomyces sulfonofaciens]